MAVETLVLLVEDHPMVRSGLADLITKQEDLAVVGQVTTTAQAMAAVQASGPDLVVVPVRLGGTFRGLRLCRSIKKTSAARVVVYTAFTRVIDVRGALLVGADAVVGKTVDAESVMGVLRRVGAGGPPVVLVPGAEAPVAHPRGVREELTARELDIVELLAESLGDKDMVHRLHIERTTVKSHVQSVLRKLGAASRRDLLRELGDSSPWEEPHGPDAT